MMSRVPTLHPSSTCGTYPKGLRTLLNTLIYSLPALFNVGSAGSYTGVLNFFQLNSSTFERYFE